MVIIYYHLIYINYADILKINIHGWSFSPANNLLLGPEIYACPLEIPSYYTRMMRKLHIIPITILPVPRTIAEGLQAETKWRLVLPDPTWPLHRSIPGIFGYDSALAFVFPACALPQFRSWEQTNLSILIMFSQFLGALVASEILQASPSRDTPHANGRPKHYSVRRCVEKRSPWRAQSFHELNTAFHFTKFTDVHRFTTEMAKDGALLGDVHLHRQPVAEGSSFPPIQC